MRLDSMRVFAALVLVGAWSVGCGGPANGDPDGGGAGGGTGGGGGSVDSGTSDAGFAPAAHEAFPAIEAHARVVLPSPHLLGITFSGDPNQQSLDDFGSYLVTSNWMTAVGREYGVNLGTYSAKHLAEAAPGTITDTQLVSLINARITDGTLPTPPSSGSNDVYMVFFPRTTTVNGGPGLGVMCGQSGALGYHAEGTHGAVSFAYAVIPDCTGRLGDLTSTASHELIEAATDPYNSPKDGYFYDPSSTDSPWTGAYGDEVADLCEYGDDAFDGPWEVQRSWSMAEAAAGRSPCVPAPAGEVFTDVSPAPNTVVQVPAGGSATFTLTGWSSAPTAPWTIAAYDADYTDFSADASLSSDTIGNGGTVTLTLTAPASATSGQYGAVFVYSGQSNFWPVAIQVQ